MSDAVPTHPVPDALKLVIKDKVNLEFLFNQIMSEDSAAMVLDMVQSEIDAHMAKVAKYFQEQQIGTAKLAAEQFIQTLEIDDIPISIYDARSGKGNYRGEIVYINEQYAAQKISAECVILHPLYRLDNEVRVGQSLQILYQDGMGSVNDWMSVVQKAIDAKVARQDTPRYISLPVRFGLDESISGSEVADPNALGLYENMPDDTQNHIADYKVDTAAANELITVLNLLNANEINIAGALERLSVYEITDADYDKIIAELKQGQNIIETPGERRVESVEVVERKAAPMKKARRNPEAYEAARTFILNLDADAKISEIRLDKGSYKGSVLDSPFLLDGYDIQQIGDHSYVIHDVTDFSVSDAPIHFGAEHKYRYIYKDGVGSVEKVGLETDVKHTAPKAVSLPPPGDHKTIVIAQESITTTSEPVRRDPKAYEAAKAFILNTFADPKISEIRFEKSSYKGSVLESPILSDGYLVQQIGDKSFIIHDTADITVPGPSIQYGAEHKYRFIYKDGEGRIEAVDSEPVQKRSESKEAAVADNRPSTIPPNSNPVSPAKPIALTLYNEARHNAERLLGEKATIYTARTTDTPEGRSTKGEFIFVNFRYAVQKIGTNTAIVHDCELMPQSVNPKTVNGPVAITYKAGKADVDMLPAEWWREKERQAVNKAFGGRTSAVQQNARSVAETAEPEVGNR